ncbi:MAG: multidrug effflux MFS transporter [Desulfatitalea sp.]|nr:multidrug effflux MFS transporter [Desulfatitalea sp.]NNK02011.1 multidrug effflux MFS transporter [Desulfatitalea sp.]
MRKGNNDKSGLGPIEFILLMAVLMSLTALSIDTMLPALPAIGHDLGVRQTNDVQLIISMLILGLSLGQLIFGPLSDRVGRRPALFGGTLIYLAGGALCLLSHNLAVMLAGRIIQGMGAAGPRTVVVALIRDRYKGRDMAKVMSSIMSIFLVVPALAPAIGQGIMLLAGWRAIFAMLLVLAAGFLVWFAWRQPETLLPERRLPLSANRIAQAFLEVCRNRTTVGHTLIAGFVMGALFAYLNCSQQIFQDIYAVGYLFPLYFGILALSLGGATFVNARMVMRLGTHKITRWAMTALAIMSLLYLAVIFTMGGVSPLWSFMTCMLVCFFSVGFLFGNLNAIAMKPMGHIAGSASAVVGSLSSFIAVPVAVLIGRSYDGTIVPLFVGFAALSVLSLLIRWWVGCTGKA